MNVDKRRTRMMFVFTALILSVSLVEGFEIPSSSLRSLTRLHRPLESQQQQQQLRYVDQKYDFSLLLFSTVLNEMDTMKTSNDLDSSTNPTKGEYEENGGKESSDTGYDSMISRAAVLRQSILKQQVELQTLERQIACCSPEDSPSLLSSFFNGNDNQQHQPTKMTIDENDDRSTANMVFQTLKRVNRTFIQSLFVLQRKLSRVQNQIGTKNQKYSSVEDYISTQTATGVRIVKNIVSQPQRLLQLADPQTPSLMPHIPAIYARLDQLETHVNPILEKVLNNKRHLASIEPYLDEVLERFDDIEPHLPWILDNIDTLAPYTGLLLKHVDELLLYAQDDGVVLSNTKNKKKNNNDSAAVVESSTALATTTTTAMTTVGGEEQEQYKLAEQLLPYLEIYVSRLDLVGPHLPLLRPHIPRLLKKNRIAKITPHIDRLFARGYLSLGTSANLDVLLFWVGWTLNVPLLPRLFFAIPGSPRFVSWIANNLPKRFVRKNCYNVQCQLDGDYGSNWNRLAKD